MTGKILVVEDDDALATLLHYNLEKEGYDVALAPDGEEALTYARARYTSVVAESNDFARSIRQARILGALRSNALYGRPDDYQTTLASRTSALTAAG